MKRLLIIYQLNFMLQCRFLIAVNDNNTVRNDNNIFLIRKIHTANV